jgi:hypothetical protein
VAEAALGSGVSGSSAQVNKIDMSTDGQRKLVIGGNFTHFNGTYSPNIAIIDLRNDTANPSPYIVRIYSPSLPGTEENAGGLVQLYVEFSEDITIAGSPYLVLNLNGVPYNATYSGMLDSRTAIFDYTVQPGHYSPDLNYMNNYAFHFNGADITSDASGNRAIATIPPIGDPNSLAAQEDIVISTEPDVTIEEQIAQADPTNSLPIQFDVSFSHPINPATFTVGDISQAGTASGITWNIINSGNNQDFTLQATAITGDGVVQPQINAGLVTNIYSEGNNASTSVDNQVTYDSTPPAITDISTTVGSGTYGYDTLIPIEVTFDEDITVTGTPTLELSAQATLSSCSVGPGSTKLTCNFRAEHGVNDPAFDINNVNALNPGTSIVDDLGNAFVQAGGSPTPGGAGSIRDSEAITIIADRIFNGNVGTVDVFDSDTDGGIAALQGDIMVAGDFTQYDGSTYTRIIRLNSDLTIDTAFVVGTGFNNRVTTIQISEDGDGSVYVGGLFTQYKGAPVDTFVKLDRFGNLDAGFNSGTGFSGASNHTYELATANDGSGDVIVGGNFTTYNTSNAAGGIIRLNSNGSVDTTFDITAGSEFNGQVNRVMMSTETPGLVGVAGGSFTDYSGTTRNRAATVNRNATVGAFNPSGGPNSWIVDMVQAVDGTGDWYMAGNLGTYDGNTARWLVRANPDGS